MFPSSCFPLEKTVVVWIFWYLIQNCGNCLMLKHNFGGKITNRTGQIIWTLLFIQFILELSKVQFYRLPVPFSQVAPSAGS